MCLGPLISIGLDPLYWTQLLGSRSMYSKTTEPKLGPKIDLWVKHVHILYLVCGQMIW